MSYFIKPTNYKPYLDPQQTELGIQKIKDFFQVNLSAELRLRRVTAPLFVLKGTGLNDDLTGVERTVNFPSKIYRTKGRSGTFTCEMEKITPDYQIPKDTASTLIWTPFEPMKSWNIHSLYVDQWD